ncbi:porphobilinogen synthase [Armatimonas rosea]|uniref:Delta-aminolevulinic acid dehydratase n=1 Tax=Armatimonas rosea TaxID=685828 RepID=A0A7W9SQM9_ARMRO|nr:porphobilinogen synthase [Armatimonas rosea]MBB6050665.1 porphobilinogen synthase [Armatimonas rosea]
MNDLIFRPRRLRRTPLLRRMVQETSLDAADFIYPLFVRHGSGLQIPIRSMPGQCQWSPDTLVVEASRAFDEGIPAVILFGIPETKDACGSENWNPEGIIPTTIRALKKACPELLVISDMCFCEYTDHGHCGVLDEAGYLLNDPTLELLGKASVVHAEAGADIIAPSGMMDGMIGAIRGALDSAGLVNTVTMSYAAKYASGFYGPFRDAAESPPQFGDRGQYQMDPANRREALREVALDVEQGADILMVKPALAYLDIIREVRDAYELPLAAYQVSGEYAMLHAAAQNGWIDLQRCALESLVSIKRAGADMILTYFARDAVRWLAER